MWCIFSLFISQCYERNRHRKGGCRLVQRKAPWLYRVVLIVMVCDYVSFCTEILIPYELVKDFPNNKPRISYNTKGLLHRKQVAFKQEGLNAVREIKKMVEVDMSKTV